MKLETGKTYKCIPKPGTKARYGRINAFQYHPMGLGIDPAKQNVIINGQKTQRQSDKTIFVGVASGDQFEIVDHIAEPQLSEFFNYVESDPVAPTFHKDGTRQGVYPKAGTPARFKDAASYIYSPASADKSHEIDGKAAKQPSDKPVILYGKSLSDPGTDAPCLGFCSEAEFGNWFSLSPPDGPM